MTPFYCLIIHIDNDDEDEKQAKRPFFWTSLLVSSSDCYLDLLPILHLSNPTKITTNTETAMPSLLNDAEKESKM